MTTTKQKFWPDRERIHEIIFEADTPAGKAFDVWLLVLILLSTLTVMLESVPALHDRYLTWFVVLEWSFTILFTIEYGVRLYSVRKPMKYATSFFGIIDLLAILPSYLSLLVAGTQYLMIVRLLRLLRVFRIFKLVQFMRESRILLVAMRASRLKITVFLFGVLVMVCIYGSIMYLVEGSTNEGFSSIPRSIYWAIVTLTTVGFGDITPQTPFGQFLASIVMITGYAVIAVPTGIMSAELMRQVGGKEKSGQARACPDCGRDDHEADADYCRFCGGKL
jgi:voltage-gated potassium channel